MSRGLLGAAVMIVAVTMVGLGGACEDKPAPTTDGGALADAAAGPQDRASLKDIESTIFATNCVFSVCHGVESPQRGLSLVSPTYESLISKRSPITSKARVVAFAPQASYLLEKLELDQPTAGQRMPPDQPLPPADIAKIKAWIEQGAENN